MKIIDSHAHIFPPRIEGVAVNAISDFYFGRKMAHGGSPEELLRSGEKIGVSKYLVFTAATTPRQVETINSFIIEQCALHPEFLGAGTMHTGYAENQDFEAEIDRLHRGGVRGIKLHPDFQTFAVDDPRLFPVYELLQSRGMFMITHSGDYRYEFSTPIQVARVAKSFPDMRVIAAHFAGWMQWSLAREHLNLPNVYMDTSSTIGFAGREPARKALEVFDPTHIFFATDFPMWDHAEELERFLGLNLPDSLTEDILYNNFAAFYGL